MRQLSSFMPCKRGVSQVQLCIAQTDRFLFLCCLLVLVSGVCLDTANAHPRLSEPEQNACSEHEHKLRNFAQTGVISNGHNITFLLRAQ